MKVWIRKRKNNKTLAQFTVELSQKEASDLARPIIMNKHINELLSFGHTVFRADDFIEKIDFDRLEVELF